MDTGEQSTETSDEYRNLLSVLRNASQEADACSGYIFDAEAAGEHKLAGFFREVQRMQTTIAARTGQMIEWRMKTYDRPALG